MKLAIAGCTGRMGLALIEAALATEGVRVVAGSARPGFDENAAKAQLETVGAKNLFVTSDIDTFVQQADAVLDFTTPEATLATAKAVATQGGIHIIGTTGLSDKQQQEIKKLSAKARIVQSGNFSPGVTVLSQLVEQAAKLLDDSYDIEIFEMHHKHKKDAPSGTALMLGGSAAKGRSVSLDKKKVLERKGERKRGDIGFSVSRGGDVVGIHTISFAGGGEVLELGHQGFSREIYAHGAIRAALWAKKQKPGLYAMSDVLGL